MGRLLSLAWPRRRKARNDQPADGVDSTLAILREQATVHRAIPHAERSPHDDVADAISTPLAARHGRAYEFSFVR